MYLDIDVGEVGHHATYGCWATTTVHVRDTLACGDIGVELGLEVLKVESQVQDVCVSDLHVHKSVKKNTRTIGRLNQSVVGQSHISQWSRWCLLDVSKDGTSLR